LPLEGHAATYSPALRSIFEESEGYAPAESDRLIEISGESGGIAKVMMLKPCLISFRSCRAIATKTRHAAYSREGGGIDAWTEAVGRALNSIRPVLDEPDAMQISELSGNLA
jgi:hypothetical protein